MSTIRRLALVTGPILVLACGGNSRQVPMTGGGGGSSGAGGGGGGGQDGPASTGGASGTGGGSMAPLPLAISAQEVATRLAKFLWNAAPDAALLQRAGALKNREEVGPLALEMLKDPRSRTGIAAFYRWWLALDQVATRMGDPKTYPELTVAVAADAAKSTETFAVDVTLDGDGSFRTLMTGSSAYVNQRLASLYGLTGVVGADLKKVALDPKERAGILTQLAMLLEGSDFPPPVSDTDPPLRGRRMRNLFYCYPLLPLLGVSGLPAPMPQSSNRQYFELLTGGHSPELGASFGALCPSCHYGHELNMLGFAFEGFDGIGRRRTADRRGHPVDVSGLKIRNDAGQDVTFNGPVQLAGILTDSAAVQRCVGGKWLTFALQQALSAAGQTTPADDSEIDGVHAAFKTSGLDLRALIAAVTETDAFLAPAGAKTDGGTDAGASDGGVVVGTLPEGCAMARTILASCTSCHNAQAAPAFGGLDMATAGWEKKLIGAPPPAGAPGTNACNGNLNYLNKTQPTTGLFLDKLKTNPPCGAQMPLAAVAPPLSASELACVQKWANNVVAGGPGQ